MKDSPNLYLIIIWHNALNKFEDIVSDIDKKFIIRKIYNLQWSKQNFKKNLKRFYSHNLSPFPDKEITSIIDHKSDHCGSANFSAIIIEDPSPKLEPRNTSAGNIIVNSNIFDSKSIYRKWTGGGHKIHASNDLTETNHDLSLLLGLNLTDFHKKYPKWDGKVEEIPDLNIPGGDGWDSIEQLFYTLNNTINYVVLRNFDNIPEEYHVPNHNDIDLLVSNYKKASIIINGKNTQGHKNCVHHHVKINNIMVPFDFRYVGDNYYDEKWQKNILNNKKLNKNLFYTPNDTDYFYSLLYHATIQKFEDPMPLDYKTKIQDLAEKYKINLKPKLTNKHLKELLNEFMIINNYQYYQPIDPTVSSPKINYYSGLKLNSYNGQYE